MHRHNLPISVEIRRIGESLLRFLKAGNETERYKEKQHDLASGLRAKSASRSTLQLKLFGISLQMTLLLELSFFPVLPSDVTLILGSHMTSPKNSN